MTRQKMKNRQFESGEVDGWMISTIGLIVGFLAAGSLAIWFGLEWREAQTNLDGKVDAAVATAEREQAERLSEEFRQAQNQTVVEFVGPAETGRLSFDYPRDWKVHVARDGDGGNSNYEAYIHPVAVPPISRNEQYAVRVLIENTDYNRVLDSYSRLIDDGQLRSSTFTASGENGVRLDGNLDRNIRGAAVVFQVRDKTVTVRTDADTFMTEFNRLVETISFNR